MSLGKSLAVVVGILIGLSIGWAIGPGPQPERLSENTELAELRALLAAAEARAKKAERLQASTQLSPVSNLEGELRAARSRLKELEQELALPAPAKVVYMSALRSVFRIDPNLNNLEGTIKALQLSEQSPDENVVALGTLLLRELAPDDDARVRSALSDLRSRRPGPIQLIAAEYILGFLKSHPESEYRGKLEDLHDSLSPPQSWGCAFALAGLGEGSLLRSWVDFSLDTVVTGNNAGIMNILAACEVADFDGRDDIVLAAALCDSPTVVRKVAALLVDLGTPEARGALEMMLANATELTEPILRASLKTISG